MALPLPNFVDPSSVTDSIAELLKYPTSNSHIFYDQNQFMWLACQCLTFVPGQAWSRWIQGL